MTMTRFTMKYFCLIAVGTLIFLGIHDGGAISSPFICALLCSILDNFRVRSINNDYERLYDELLQRHNELKEEKVILSKQIMQLKWKKEGITDAETK